MSLPSITSTDDAATPSPPHGMTTPKIEQRSFEHVPLNERHGNVRDQRKFWFMANATLITLFSGAVGGAAGLGLGWTVVAIVLGSLVGTVFQALHAAQGPVMGIPQMIQSRVQFGARGALIPLVAAILTLCGFPIFLVQSAGAALSAVTPVPVLVGQTALAVVAVAVAIVGYNLVLRAEKTMAWLALASFVLLTVAVALWTPWAEVAAGAWAFSLSGLLAQAAASAVLQLGVAPIVSDYTRYLPRDTSGAQVTGAVFGGTLVSAVWLSVLGAVLVAAGRTGDLVAEVQAIGNASGLPLGNIALWIAVPAATLTATTGLYSAAVSILSGADAIRPVHTTGRLRAKVLAGLGVVVVVANLVMPADMVDSFGTFLVILGYFLVPWTAVNLVDFYLVRRGVYSITDILRTDGGMYGLWNTRGMIAYGAGFVSMVPFASVAGWTGPVAAALGADVSFLVGLLVSSVTYLALSRGHDQDAEIARVRVAPLNTLQH